jgi:hypothetical protein
MLSDRVGTSDEMLITRGPNPCLASGGCSTAAFRSAAVHLQPGGQIGGAVEGEQGQPQHLQPLQR